MGHYLYEDVQQVADLVRFGSRESSYHLRQTLLAETDSQTVTDQNTDYPDDCEWSEFYKVIDMAG